MEITSRIPGVPKTSDTAVRWMDRVFYVAVTATVAIHLPDAISSARELDSRTVAISAYIAALTAWLYAMWTRERKPPRDSL